MVLKHTKIEKAVNSAKTKKQEENALKNGYCDLILKQ